MSSSDNALATLNLPFVDRVEGFVHNAIYGTLTQEQKTALEQQQADSVVKASGGSVSQQDAMAQAQRDVTSVLTQAGADPSQSSFLGSPGLESLLSKVGWIIAILFFVAIAYVGIQFWLAVRR